MKKQLVTIVGVAGVLILGSCTEKGPAIDFSSVKSVDTTYVLDAPEAAQPRMVLVEEATGVKCPNCPAGAKILKEADSVNQGRLVIVGLHAKNQTSPLPESKYDFRKDEIILPIFSFFGGEPNKPAAVFDRTKQGSVYFLDNRTAWPNLISQRLNTPSPIRLSMTSKYNDATHEDTITIRVSYTSAVTKKHSIAILITEDSIVDVQEDGLNIIEHYDHEHVFRDYVTSHIGTSFLDSLATKEPGRVYERTFIYKVPDIAFGVEKTSWNLDNCKVIGFVVNNESNDYEVAQAIEIELK